MTSAISPAGSTLLAARIDMTDDTSTPPRTESPQAPKSQPKGGAGTPASSSGGSAPRVEPDLQFAAEVRVDQRPRDPYRPPLPDPSPDAAIAGEARIGIRARPTGRVTLNVYGRAAAKGQLNVEDAEYSLHAVGAASTLRLSPRTAVTAGVERLHIFGPPAPRGPLDYKATEVTVSATRTLTSKPAAPGHPSVKATAAFSDRQASRPAQNIRSARLTVSFNMPLRTNGPQLIGSWQGGRTDYTAGSNKGQGVWSMAASFGPKFQLGKWGLSITPFVEGRFQLSNRPNRDDRNVAFGVRLARGPKDP